MTYSLFDSPHALGHGAAQACLDKAQLTGFDGDGARSFIAKYLRTHGVTAGEVLVNAAKAHGYVGHDDRCFGAVFAGLARKNVIRCVGYAQRAKGHGTSGARLWEAV